MSYDATAQRLTLQATDVSSALATGGAVASLQHAAGTLVVTTGGVAGWAHGAVTLAGVPGVALDAALDLEVNTTGGTVDVPDGAGTRTLNGSFLRLTGSGTIAIAGLAEISGAVSLQVSGATVQVAISGSSLAAALIVYGDGSVAGAGTASAALPVAVPGVTLAGTVTLQINTTGAPVPSTVVAVGATSVTVAYASATRVVSATGALRLTTPVGDVAGTFALSANLGNRDLTITGTGVDLFLGTRGATAADDVGLSLSGASLAVRVRSDGTYALRASGAASLANLSALTFSGTFAAEVNTLGEDATLDGAVVAAGTRRLAGRRVTLVLPGGISASGDLVVERSTNPVDATPELVVGASQLAVTAGDPAGVNVAASGAELLLLVSADHSYALQASGTAAIRGVAGLTLGGSIAVVRSTRTTAVSRQITVGGAVRSLDVDAGASRFGGDHIELDVLGQTLRGGFTFANTAAGVDVTLADAAIMLGGGLFATDGVAGTLSLNSAQKALTATITAASVRAGVPGFAVAGSAAAALAYSDNGNADDDSLSVTVGGTTPATLTVAGEQLSGTFTFTGGAQTVTIGASAVGLSLGTYVVVSGGSGTLVLASDGATGTLSVPSATLAVPGLVSGTFRRQRRGQHPAGRGALAARGAVRARRPRDRRRRPAQRSGTRPRRSAASPAASSSSARPTPPARSPPWSRSTTSTRGCRATCRRRSPAARAPSWSPTPASRATSRAPPRSAAPASPPADASCCASTPRARP